jgi:hypothetical protein
VVEDYDPDNNVHQEILQRRPDAKHLVAIFDETGRKIRTQEKIVGVFSVLKKRGESLAVSPRHLDCIKTEPVLMLLRFICACHSGSVHPIFKGHELPVGISTVIPS